MIPGLTLGEPPCEPDYTQRVAERIAEMTYSELREAREMFRSPFSFLSERYPGESFGQWLRSRIAREIEIEDRNSGPDEYNEEGL